MSLLERFSLHGSVALVSGAGKGVGQAIALAYAEAGARVVCAARTLADVEAVAEQIRQRGGQGISVCCAADDAGQRAAAVPAAVAALGTLPPLVHTAGR